MSKTLTPETTRHVARLARLHLTEAEVKEYTRQLTDVLEHIEMLKKVKVDGVEPMTHPLDLPTPMREDTVHASLRDTDGRPLILKSAKEVLYDGFKTPPILGEG